MQAWLIPLSQVDLDVVLRPGCAAGRGGDGWLYGQGAVAFPIPADLFRRGALRRVSVRTAMAGWICLPRMRRPPRGGAEEPSLHVRMSRLRPPDLDYGGHGDASLQTPLTTWFWAAHLMATHSNGMSARQFEDQLGLTYKTAWLLTQKLRRSMVDPNRELLEGVVEVDQTEIPFRADDAFFDPDGSGKILIAGAVEVIDRDTNQAVPRRKHAKYLDTRSGRIRLAMIANNSAASIEAFVRTNVKRGTTLITDGHASFLGLRGDYPHDPRVVGKMAAHVVLPWIHRVFALMKRWSLGTYHGLRRKHVDTYLEEFVFRYNRRFYRHVSFETLLGIASHHEPVSYWDIAGRANPRKCEKIVRRTPRQRKTAAGMRRDGSATAQNQPAEIAKPLDMDKPGTTG